MFRFPVASESRRFVSCRAFCFERRRQRQHVIRPRLTVTEAATAMTEKGEFRIFSH